LTIKAVLINHHLRQLSHFTLRTSMRPHLLVILATCFLIAADDQKGEPAKTDRDKMQGTWVVISIEANGMKYSADEIKGEKLVIKAGKFESSQQESSFMANPSKTPKEIIVTDLAGPNKGIPQKGIYSLEKDILKLCLCRKKGDIATKFETKAGDERWLVVYKREEKKP